MFESSSALHWRPRGLTFTWWGWYGLCPRHRPTELTHYFFCLFCSYVCFCLYGPFNCISFDKFSGQLSSFSLCSSGLISAVLVLSTISLFMKVSLGSDIILYDWLGLKHQLTNSLFICKERTEMATPWTVPIWSRQKYFCCIRIDRTNLRRLQKELCTHFLRFRSSLSSCSGYPSKLCYSKRHDCLFGVAVM